jgi:hypothetical protein
MIMKRFLVALLFLFTLAVVGIAILKKVVPTQRLEGIGIGSSTHLRVGTNGLADGLSQVKELGATWIREEFPWNEIQQAPGQFRWSYGDGKITHDFDELVAEAKAKKLQILAVLDGGPVFLAHIYPGMPVDLKDLLVAWEGYIQAVVDRYGDQITAWEIGNRENTREGWGKVLFPTASNPQAKPDPELYSQMLTIAYKIIKNQDANARVILGGVGLDEQDCSEDAYTFLAGVKESGGWQSFDAIGVQITHRGTWPEQASSLWNDDSPSQKNCASKPPDLYSVPEEIQSVVSFAKGLGEKPIWITSLGYDAQAIDKLANNDKNAAALVESDILVRTAIPLLANPSVQKLFWYTLVEDPLHPGYAMGPFGQISLANINEFLRGSKPVGIFADSGMPKDVNAYAFQNNGKTIFFIWRAAADGIQEPVFLPGLQGDSAVAYAADVAEISTRTARSLTITDEGVLHLMVSQRPQIIIIQDMDLSDRIQTTAQDQVDQVKESVDAGVKTLWEGLKFRIATQISTWLNEIKESILQIIHQKLNQLFK